MSIQSIFGQAANPELVEADYSAIMEIVDAINSGQYVKSGIFSMMMKF